MAAHLLPLGVALLTLVLPRRRAALGLLAVAMVLINLSSSGDVNSHSTVTVAALLLVLLFSVAEIVEGRFWCGRRSGLTVDWYGWTLRGLRWLGALMYWFACFYKLNPNWLSPQSSRATDFLRRPLEPLLALAGLPADASNGVLSPVAIYGTLLLEAGIPILLLNRSTALVGCLAGLALHLPMLAQGIADFPLIALGLYPAFLSKDEVSDFGRRLARWPGSRRLVATGLLIALGLVSIFRAPQFRELVDGSATNNSVLLVAYGGMQILTFVLVAHVTCTLVVWCSARGWWRSGRALEEHSADGVEAP